MSKLKLTFISDTHGKEPELSGGDILFHTGDLSCNGYKVEIVKQLNYLHEQKEKYKYVVLIAGNHDFWAERHPEEFKEACLSAGILMLKESSLFLDGLNIWGSPATPFFHNWAFNYYVDDIKEIWDKIPDKLDILLTHGPVLGILDQIFTGKHVGCIVLRDKVLEMEPKIHACGHIHEEGGNSLETNNTLFLNSAESIINVDYDNILKKVLRVY